MRGRNVHWDEVFRGLKDASYDGTASPSFAQKELNTSCSSSLGKPHHVLRLIP